jgi:hypothetical protein
MVKSIELWELSASNIGVKSNFDVYVAYKNQLRLFRLLRETPDFEVILYYFCDLSSPPAKSNLNS